MTHSFAAPDRRWHVALCAAALAATLTTGCADMTEQQRGTAVGAGVGAGAGAILAGSTGGRSGTGAVIGGALGAVAGNLWSRRMEERRNAMEQATAGTGVEVSRTEDNRLELNIPDDISFDTGSAAIKPALRRVLDPFAASLRGDPTARLLIIGHTDSTGSPALNERLSRDRAQSVRDDLVAHGVAASRVQIEGRGDHEPVADNATEAGRARNRRVEMFLREPAPE